MLSFLSVNLPQEVRSLIIEYFSVKDMLIIELVDGASAATILEAYKILFKKEFKKFPIDEFVTWFNHHFPPKVTALPWSKKYYQQCLSDSGLDWVMAHQSQTINFLKAAHKDSGIPGIIEAMSLLSLNVSPDLSMLKINQNLIECINELIFRIRFVHDSKVLSLREAGITHLPENLFIKKDLKEYWSKIVLLSVEKNHLAFLPSWISKLPNLERIICYDNKLMHLPKNIGKLKKLFLLSLYGNQLVEIPTSITKIRLLRHLNLCNNNLSKLPDDIHKLKRLEYLSFSSNKFEEFPKNIDKLKSLEILFFSCNKIKKIPRGIVKLKKLKYLEGSNNELNYLPRSLGELPSLINFAFKNNFLKKLPIGFNKISIRAADETLKNQNTIEVIKHDNKKHKKR